MKLLVNATACVVGGGVQVSTTFVRRALRSPHGHEWMFAVSPLIMRNIEPLSGKQAEKVVEISPSPGRMRRGMRTRRRLRQLENEFHPDAVFTVFGPAYVRFAVPHICGFADGWVTHASQLAVRSLPYLARFRQALTCYGKVRCLSSDDFYSVEAPVAQRGLMRILRIPEHQVRVIPNSFSPVFSEAPQPERPKETGARPLRVFTLAHPHPNKNLAIIPKLARILREIDPAREYCFTVTLPEASGELKKFRRSVKAAGVESMIENAGRLQLDECPQWYAKSDIVLLPTLLETFSATYPEAMQMGKPIVTTDLDFAREICGDAAVYYSPLSARSAAEAIKKVANDKQLEQTLIAKGYEQLKKYPSPEEKFQMQLDWIETVARARN